MFIRQTLKALATVAALSALPVHALIITPTYDPSSSFTASEKAAINAAIGVFQSTFSDPISVKINFTNNPTGLAGNSVWILSGSYGTVKGLLLADAKTAADTTADATLGASDPFFADLIVTTAECRAIAGGCGFGPDGFDGTININTTFT